MNIYITALLSAIVFSCTGQILLKKGAMLIDNTQLMQTTVLNIYLMLGIAIYGLSTLLYIVSLRKLDLAVAYPTSSLSYILLLAISCALFGEVFTLSKLIGIFMIIGGVFFLWK